jgi:hypothetical protein
MILRLVSGAAVAFALVLTGAVATVFVAPPSVAACGDETCEGRVPSDARLHLPSGLKPFAELVNMERISGTADACHKLSRLKYATVAHLPRTGPANSRRD